MAEYSVVHQAFSQACANHGVLSIPQALNIYMYIKRNHQSFDETVPDEDDLKQLIDRINENLEELDQKLVYVTVELDMPHDKFIVFTNTTQTEILKVQGVYSEIECLYFKRVLEELIINADHCLMSMNLLNLCVSVVAPNSTKKITKQRAQSLIEHWCQSGYFVEIDDRIYIGPRTIGEFEKVLRTKFSNYIHNCFLCKETTFKGVRCGNDNCDTMFHKKCFDKYSVRNKKCPQCKDTWSDE